MSEVLVPEVTWDHFCEVSRLSVETLKDNARLRQQIAEQHQSIIELLNQREQLYEKLKAAGVPMRLEGMPFRCRVNSQFGQICRMNENHVGSHRSADGEEW